MSNANIDWRDWRNTHKTRQFSVAMTKRENGVKGVNHPR